MCSPTNVTPVDYETVTFQGGGSEIDAAGYDPGGRSLNLLWGLVCYEVL